MTPESAFATIIIMLLYVAKPGPTILALISRSLSDGFSAGFSMALGNAAAHIVYFLMAAYGYSFVESQLEFASFFLKSIGAAYLIYIGIKGLIHLEAGTWGGKEDQLSKITLVEHYFAGLMICISSPFSILFYVAIIPQILPLASLNGLDIFAATIIIVGTYLLSHTVVSYFCSSARNTFKSVTFVRRVNLIVSFIFIALGLFLAVSLLPLFNFELNF